VKHAEGHKTEKDWRGVGRPQVAMHSQLPRTPEYRSVKVLHPLNLHGETCSIVNNSIVDYSITLKFCTEFKHMTS